MLDLSTHQASGLLTLANPQGPRLVAMVNHGDESVELPLLWRLCAAMVGFGYSVTVLDATTCESEANPGLEQLLEYDFWRANAHSEIPAWTVVPAAFGLQNLGLLQDRKEEGFEHLGQLFQSEGVLILYGKAQWLVPFLSNHPIKPLLAVAPHQSALLSSYVALKHLLLDGGLAPTIVNLVQDKQPAGNSRLRAIATTLSDCARNFLGYDVNALNIAAPTEDDQPSQDMRHLALRMLEGSMALQPHSPATMGRAETHRQNHYTGAH